MGYLLDYQNMGIGMRFCPTCNTQYSDKIEYCFHDGDVLEFLSSDMPEYDSVVSQSEQSHASEDVQVVASVATEDILLSDLISSSAQGDEIQDLVMGLEKGALEQEDSEIEEIESPDEDLSGFFDEDLTDTANQNVFIEGQKSVALFKQSLEDNSEEEFSDSETVTATFPYEIPSSHVTSLEGISKKDTRHPAPEIPQDGFGLLSMEDLLGFSSESTSPMLRPKGTKALSRAEKNSAQTDDNTVLKSVEKGTDVHKKEKEKEKEKETEKEKRKEEEDAEE